MKLGEIFGQEAVVKALRFALESECLAGSYLIVGPDGTGKMAVAQAFAQAAACLTPVTSPFDACGVCESCRRMDLGTQSEIVTVKPAGEQLQIWQLWDRPGRPPGVLSRTLSYAPVLGRRRITILAMADRLTEQAANSLLKRLEEPPPYALFLLLAPNTARVLPTIVSRSQIIRLRAVPAADLAGYLRDVVQVDSERAAMLAAYSEGRTGQAISLARGAAVASEIDRILDYAEGLPAAPPYRALRAAEQMRKLAVQTKALLGEEPADSGDAPLEEGDVTNIKEKVGRRQFAAVFDLLVTFYRDLLSLRVGAGEEALIHRQRSAALSRLAQLGSVDRWTVCLDALLLARRRLDANANVSLVTEILAMRLLETV